jgi:IS1 family transposase
MVSMNKLSTEQRTRIVAALVEGNSIRATCRMTGAAKNTVVKLLVDRGGACSEYQDKAMRDLPCTHLQCDEIWSFCYAKEKNVAPELQGQIGYGDTWTWTAIDADTKIVPTWHIGRRDAAAAKAFIDDLAGRLASRVQLTTDGHKPYLQAVEDAFGADIDYAVLIKIYGADPANEKRYSAAECIGSEKIIVQGQPDLARVSTSYVERQNLTMRMGMRRFTRLTNGFSKKVENLAAAVALHFMHYNFARIHKTLKQTPAMAAGISDHVWSLEEIVGLLDSN